MNSKPPLVLLAGGENKRFFPLNTTTHKSCQVVAGKPLLIWALEDAVSHGFTQVIMVVSPKDFDTDNVSREIEKRALPLQIEYVLQPEARGQADAIILGTKSVQNECVVASPYYLNLGEVADQVIEAAAASQAECVLLGSQTDQPQHYGVLGVQGSRVTSVTEKPDQPTSNIKINSVYLLKKPFLDFLSHQPKDLYSLESALDAYAQAHQVEWRETKEHPSLKFAWQLLDFMNVLLQQQSKYISPSAKVAATAVLDHSKGNIYIDDGATLGDFVKVLGPAYIGKDTLIGDYSFIRHSAIEANAVVGAYTEVVRSLVASKATIHHSYCADSIIGPRSKVSSGLNTANKRLDRENVRVTVGEKKIDTQRSNLGVITGEAVNLGISVNTMPGVLMGSNSTIYPGVTLFNTVAPHSTIKQST